jgi:hypothetical protein
MCYVNGSGTLTLIIIEFHMLQQNIIVPYIVNFLGK